MTESKGTKIIEARGLYKGFDGREVLSQINAIFGPGGTSCIIGRNSAGETVMLRCLIGLVRPASGEILFNGHSMTLLSRERLKQLRQVTGVLFQGSALFDSMAVLENVLFPLQLFSKLSPRERKAHAMAFLDRVGLGGAQRKFPSEVSGGMMKHVAVARAVALNSHYLFCDEPDSGLDPTTSASTGELLKELTEEYRITTVINTYDMNPIETVVDHILYLDKGQVTWQGSRRELKDDIPAPLKGFLCLWYVPSFSSLIDQ